MFVTYRLNMIWCTLPWNFKAETKSKLNKNRCLIFISCVIIFPFFSKMEFLFGCWILLRVFWCLRSSLLKLALPFRPLFYNMTLLSSLLCMNFLVRHPTVFDRISCPISWSIYTDGVWHLEILLCFACIHFAAVDANICEYLRAADTAIRRMWWCIPSIMSIYPMLRWNQCVKTWPSYTACSIWILSNSSTGPLPLTCF